MSPRDGNRRRPLSREERVLWKAVTQSVVPRRKPVDTEDDSEPARKPEKSKRTTKTEPTVLPQRSEKRAPPSLSPLDRRVKQRVARGKEPIEGRLDLHGFTQSEAHGELLRFLRAKAARGARMVLVITGKGRGDGERGVLKRQVPLWLGLPEFRALVVGFEDAHITHGGEGALYVRLRRQRGE